MIKLLFSGKQILIASLVFILLANTTNLTFPNNISEKTTKDWIPPAEATKENDFLSPENVDKSITFIGENEPGFIKTPEQKTAEEQELIADMEDDLADADTSKEKKAIQANIDKAKERFGLDKEDKEKLKGYDEQGRQLDVINGDYDEEPKQIEDWQNQVNTNPEEEYHGPMTHTYKDKDLEEQHQKEIKEFNENQEDDNNPEEATEKEEEADESQDEGVESVDDSSGGEEDDESEEEQDEPEEEEQDEPEEESESEE